MELVGLVVWVVAAIGAGAIARSKNRSFFGYFLLGAFLPLIGLIISAGMAPRLVDSSAPRRGFSAVLVIVAFVVIVGGLLIVNAIDRSTPSSSAGVATSQDPHSQTGCSASRRAIEAQLKSPGSAKWVDCTSTPSAGVQTVTLTVDSQNSYGALTRTQWVTTVRNNTVEKVQQVR